MRSTCDNVQVIKAHLESGLEGLYRLQRLRSQHHAAKLGEDEALNSFLICGSLVLDELGQLRRAELELDYRKCPDLVAALAKAQVIPLKHLFEVLPTISVSMSFLRFPELEDKCPECGEGWSIENLNASVFVRQDEDPGFIFRHPMCHQLRRDRDTLNMLRNVCVEAGLKDPLFYPTPNKYWKDPKTAGPWIRIQTRLGEIEMGWRKNVMSINWSDIVEKKTENMGYTEKRDTNKALEAETLFPKEEVTRSGHAIHAHGLDKSAEYLRGVLRTLGLVA